MSKEKKSMEDIHKIMEGLYKKRVGMSTEETIFRDNIPLNFHRFPVVR